MAQGSSILHNGAGGARLPQDLGDLGVSPPLRPGQRGGPRRGHRGDSWVRPERAETPPFPACSSGPPMRAVSNGTPRLWLKSTRPHLAGSARARWRPTSGRACPQSTDHAKRSAAARLASRDSSRSRGGYGASRCFRGGSCGTRSQPAARGCRRPADATADRASLACIRP